MGPGRACFVDWDGGSEPAQGLGTSMDFALQIALPV
jgi:hypothetical protein